MIEISLKINEKTHRYMFMYDVYSKFRMTAEFKSWTKECLQDFWFYDSADYHKIIFYFKSPADAMIFKLAFFNNEEKDY